MTFDVFDNASDVAREQALRVIADANEAIASRGRFTIALAGGSTPKATYALLAEQPYRDAVDWTRIHIYFGDERCVPPSDVQSNFRMASDALLDRVPIPRGQIHRMRGEDDPARAASSYADEIRRDLGAAPIFDCVLLGMGPDGHTASLFPGSDPCTETERLARAVYANAFAMWRITLTPTVFNAARHILFAVTGAEKADALRVIRLGHAEPTSYPAAAIAPSDGTLTWLLDRMAAGEDTFPTPGHTQER